jgi:hypothetical protein
MIDELGEMYSAIVDTAKMVAADEAIWDDAPDEFLDAILSTPLKDPIAVPMDITDLSNLIFTNRETLHHHLLKEKQHPYTKRYLDERMVDEFNARPEIESALSALKQRMTEWMRKKIDSFSK